MDAVQNRHSILKIALPILTAALLLLAPGHATAAPTFIVDTNSVNIVGGEGGNVNVRSSDGTTIQFQAVANYPGAQTPWISINSNIPSFTTVGGLNAGAGGTRVSFQAGITPDNTSASVTLHATSPSSGVPDVTISITYTNSGSCTSNCGGGYVVIYANPGTVSADNYSNPTSTQPVTLSTTSTSSVSFSLGTQDPETWLHVTTSGSAVDNNNTATLTLRFNSAGMAAGVYPATITVNYGTSQSLSIAVNYTVIASTVVTLTPSSAIWSGTTQSTTVMVAAGTPTMTVVVSGTSPWILLSWPNAPSYYASSRLDGVNTATGFVAKYNAAAAPSVGDQGTVTVSDANGHSSIFTVTYNGVTGGGGGADTGTVTVTPNPATMSAALNSSCCVDATVTVASTVSGSMTAALSNSTCNGCFSLSTPSSSITAGTPASITVSGNPYGLTTGSYTATLTVSVTVNGTVNQGTTQVNLMIGGGSPVGGAVVAPSTLTFAQDANHHAETVPQVVTIADAGAYTATVTAGAPWLTIISAATGTSGGYSSPALLQVAAGSTTLGAGTYNGTVSIQSPSGVTLVSVILNIYSAPILYVNAGGPGGPGTVNATEAAGNLGVVPQPYVYSSDGSAMVVQATISGSPSWLQLNETSATTSPSYPAVFPLVVAGANLPNGLYTAYVTFSTPSATNSPLTLPVVLSVGGSLVTSGITLSQSAITLNGTVGGYTTAAQVGVTSNATTAFTATTSVSSGGVNWLTVTPSGSASTVTSYITVTANPSGLAAGTYYGTVTVAGGGSTPQLQVIFVVGNSGSGGGNVVSNPTSLTFTFQSGGTLPVSQNLQISNQVAGTGQIAFTVQTAISGSVANWLSAAVNGSASGQTQATVAVSVNPGSLPAGFYTGTVTITPTGGNVVSIPVTLNVQGLTAIVASPSPLSFSYQLGGNNPPSQAVQVSGSATGLPYGVTVAMTTGSGWLSVNKSSGITPDVLSVSVSPSNLAAGTSYSGTITVQGTGTAAGSNPSVVSVTVTVTAPYPTISLVQGAASLANGASRVVSPGELITIFGTGLGPATPLQTALDPTTHKVATTLGNVQVLFNGYPAPLTYVSATQINCVAPYELAQLTGPYVQVKYGGQGSNTYDLTQAATSPGIFTSNATGSGQGAILNFDSTYNGTAAGFTPAAAGSVIQVYMTGEGQTSPAGVTGKVNCPSGSTCTIAQLPVPLLPVAALVNNQPATITFWGEAPGLVSGVMQVNLIIPPGTPSGPASLVIKVGSNSSQPGVTIAVK
jgi:uncharacterized protein (TIGR03437 family)